MKGINTKYFECDTADRGDEQIAFAIDTLTKADIRIANVSEINAIAENARRELKI